MSDDATATQRLANKLEDFVDTLDDEEGLWMKVVFDTAVASQVAVDEDEVAGYVQPIVSPAVTETMSGSVRRTGAMQDFMAHLSRLSENIYTRSLGTSKG